MMTEVNRITKYLTTFSKSYPGIWRKLDQCREELGKKAQGWSNWCFLPLDHATDVLREYVSDPPTQRKCLDVPICVGLAGWRATQGIYQFDPTVYNALCSTPINGDMPVDVLYHLPEYCSYVLTPGLRFEGEDVRGFFVFLCESSGDSRKELCFAMDVKNTNGDELFVFGLDLSQTNLEAALEVSARRNIAEYDRLGFPTPGLTPAIISRMSSEIAPFLSLTLYLCTKAAEVRDAKGTLAQPARPKPKKTRKGLRLFSPSQPAVWQVAYRLGAALRVGAKTASGVSVGGDGTHASPRPHYRRAHWNYYWIGKRREPQTRRVIAKRLPPTFVNVETPEALIPVVKEVAA